MNAGLFLSVALLVTGLFAGLGCEEARVDDERTDQADESRRTIESRSRVTDTDSRGVSTAGATPGARVELGSPVIYHYFDRYQIPDPAVDDVHKQFPLGDVYGGLFRYVGTRDGEIELDLASSFSVSDDGLVYTFTMREGVRFSDGSRVSAEDVKGSWERALTPAIGSARASDVLGQIAGARAVQDGLAETLSGVTVIDDGVLEVRLTRPASYFTHLLADPVASVLSVRNVAAWGTANWSEHRRHSVHSPLGRAATTFDELPVGTGPFRLREFTWRQSATLEPNPYYWDDAGFGQVIVVMRQQFSGASSPVRFTGLDTWRVDLDTAKDIRDGVEHTLGNESLNVFRAQIFDTEPEVAWLALNSSRPPFDDVEFRRAVLHATDNSPPDTGFIDAYPDDSANGLVPHDLIPEAKAQNLESRLDRDAAITALAHSRYRDASTRPAIRFVSGPHIALPGVLDGIFGNWVDWLEVKVDLDEAASYRHSAYERALADGTLQMRLMNLDAEYPDAHSVLRWIPSAFGPDAISDEEKAVASMIESADLVRDPLERSERFRAIEAHVIDRALVIPLWWEPGTTSVLVKPYISGYKVPAYGGSQYEDVVVDTTHPEYPADR